MIMLSALQIQAQSSIDSENSKVEFSIKNMKFKTVEGSFGGMNGNVAFDPENLENSSFNVCIDPATVNTGSKKRDEHLKNEDFFDVEKYPEICFKSDEIAKIDNQYIAKGTLTMHGISNKVEIPFEQNGNTLNGQLTINRKDYKVGDDGTFMVGDEVKLNIIGTLKK